MTTISIDEHRAHADGSAPLDIPTEVIPDEHALLRLTTELADSVVENLRHWLSPAYVPTQCRSQSVNKSQFTQRDRGQCLHDELAFALLSPGFE